MKKKQEALFWAEVVRLACKKYNIPVEDTNLDVHTHGRAFRKMASDWKQISITFYK